MAKFGPAGKPPRFKGPMLEVPMFLHKEGLDAFEYQAVRGVRISEDEARNLGKKAARYNITLTVHGPYFINLCGKKETIEASKKRLIESLKIAEVMNADRVVFHPGYYGDKTKTEALKICIDVMREVISKAKNLGIKKAKLGPETTGKKSQVGSLDEVLNMCIEVESTVPTIDFAHIHARGLGSIKSKEDYAKILDKIERVLGSEAVKHMHCHFTLVEYGKGGEIRHHTLDEEEYGPSFHQLAEVIVERGIEPVIISESPVLDIDAIKMKRILEDIKRSSLAKSFQSS